KAGEPEELFGFNNNKMPSSGSVAVFGGDKLADSWPERGASVGAGWVVEDASCAVVGIPPTDPIIISDNAGGARALEMYQGTGSSDLSGSAWLANLFGRSPG